ncbi:3'-5' DNA helicase [Coemansia brasiliensis]|uniref:DNA helicase n=1 Tax=Coemansia brasiliensis TaxID=2650707 RepID=A0A9W8I734_9FUNG|nr:3'-5' DNA helicase [Coemansia brasiliensis]
MQDNNGDLGDFELDAIDDNLWNDLLADVQDLDPEPASNAKTVGAVAPQNSSRPMPTAQNQTSPRGPWHQQSVNARTGTNQWASDKSNFDRANPGAQQPNPRSSQKRSGNKRSSPSINPGQRTLDSMFAFKGKSSQAHNQQHKRPAHSNHGVNGIESPAHPPNKIARVEDIDDIVDLDFDMDDIDFADDPPNKLPMPASARPSVATTSHRQLAFKTRELVVRNTGDNTLVESTHLINRPSLDTFVYPLLGGQPARAYQQGAIQHCIFQNTLVALPTGMGKTFIAAVVMANYARWFSNSMSIFLAPTKPLVAQQMQACKNLIRAVYARANKDSGLSLPQFGSDWVVEMNGQTLPKKRRTLWSTARFVFSTPQILQNDLKTGTLTTNDAKRISLLVIDEAHRATGRYAYGESVDALHTLYHGPSAGVFNPSYPCKAAPFRVMALTATPGSKITAVNDIVQRLHIAHIFLRTEESIDVVPYIHGRQIEEMVIDLPPWLVAARDCLAMVIQRSINLLCNVCHVMTNPGDPRRISGFQIRMERDRFLSHPHGGNMDIARVSSEFTVVISLAHIMQLLSEHGLRPAWAALRIWDQEVASARRNQGTSTRAKIDCVSSKEWTTMMQEFGMLIDMLDGKIPAAASNTTADTLQSPQSNTPVRTDVVSSFFNVPNTRPISGAQTGGSGGTKRIASLAPPGTLGHPKLERLLKIVQEHFAKHDNDGTTSRIIVFSQYRGSVSEIVSVLNRLRPLATTEAFIGQGSGSSAKSSKAHTEENSDGGGGSSSVPGGWQNRGRGRGRGRGWSRGRGGYSGGGGNISSNTDEGALADIDIGDVGIRGQSQKEQLAVLDRFRKGTTNIIVATCVGEEGLDIGEVDLIVNYDAPSSPIRLLQRIGRTGRARRGKVIVFLAKDTREENSYKKAQREYKNVQARIAEGKGLQLREDLSPPMLPPDLPAGKPKRVEVHISKEDISREAEQTCSSKSKAKGKRGRASVGIQAEDMDEFALLASIYQRSSSGNEAEKVACMLARGTPWQSSESPSCLVGHSHTSVTYQRIMLGLENCRFNRELSDDSESGFQMPDISDITRAEASRAFSSARNCIANNRPQPSRAGIDRKSMSISSNDSLCDDSSTMKADASAKDKALPIVLDSSPLNDEFMFGRDDLANSSDAAADAAQFSADACRLPLLPPAPDHLPSLVKDKGKIAAKGKMAASKQPLSFSGDELVKNPSNRETLGHRRNSSQSNIFESIDNLIKAGKAKYAFDWTFTADAELLADAQAQGVDLELVDFEDAAYEEVPVVSPQRVPIKMQSIFGDIGQPGTFNSLYDEDQLRKLYAEQASSPPLAETSIGVTNHTDEERVLCCATPDIINDMSDLDNMEVFDFTTLDSFHVNSTPSPTASICADKPAVPENGAQTEGTDSLLAVEPAAIDNAALNFEIDASDIIILSDEDSGDNLSDDSKNIPASANSKPEVRLQQDNSTPAALSKIQQQRTTMDVDMSSSPLIRRGGKGIRQALLGSLDLSSDTDIPDPPITPSPLKRRSRRQGGRLIRKRSIAVSSTTPSTIAKQSKSTYREPLPRTKKKKKGKEHRQLPKHTSNVFLDAEAAIGYSDDESDGRNARQQAVSSDEGDGEDLDQELSSFIVDDDHVDFETPRTIERNAEQMLGSHETPTRDIRDIYRQSLLSPSTPESEIVRRLAERERQRRWVSDTPLHGRRGGSNDASGYAELPLVRNADSDLDDSAPDDDNSSDFEHPSELFSQVV